MIGKNIFALLCAVSLAGFSGVAQAQFLGIIFQIENTGSTTRDYISHTSSVSVLGPAFDPLAPAGIDASLTDGGKTGAGVITYDDCTVNYSWFPAGFGTFVSVNAGPDCTATMLTPNPVFPSNAAYIKLDLTD